MLEDHIQSQINGCRNEIYECQERIRKIKKDITKLESCYEKIKKKYQQFEESQVHKLKVIGRILNESNDVPMAEKVYCALKKQYTGKRAKCAENSFHDARQEVRNNINKAENILESEQLRLANLQSQLNNSIQQLNDLKAQGGK